MDIHNELPWPEGKKNEMEAISNFRFQEHFFVQLSHKWFNWAKLRACKEVKIKVPQGGFEFTTRRYTHHPAHMRINSPLLRANVRLLACRRLFAAQQCQLSEAWIVMKRHGAYDG